MVCRGMYKIVYIIFGYMYAYVYIRMQEYTSNNLKCMQMNTNNEEWLRKNALYLRIRVVEHTIGCPVNTIQKWLNGERNMSERWGDALDEFVEGLRMCGGSVNMILVGDASNTKEAVKAVKAEKSPGKVKVLKEVITAQDINEGKSTITEKIAEVKKEVVSDFDIETVELKPADAVKRFEDILSPEEKEKLMDIKPNIKQLEGIWKRKTDNIRYNGKWYEVSVMTKKDDKFDRIVKYTNTFEAAEEIVIELRKKNEQHKLGSK